MTMPAFISQLLPEQIDALGRLEGLYRQWNQRINVISRQDIDNLYVHHVLHSLTIALSGLPLGARVLDLGTGGGFPGIPLAIVCPQVHFTLIDGTAKKVRVAQAVADALGLANVACRHQRAEQISGERFDTVVTRGVASLMQLIRWASPLAPSLIALKGGKAAETEVAQAVRAGHCCQVMPVSQLLPDEPYFAEKTIIHVTIRQ